MCPRLDLSSTLPASRLGGQSPPDVTVLCTRKPRPKNDHPWAASSVERENIEFIPATLGRPCRSITLPLLEFHCRPREQDPKSSESYPYVEAEVLEVNMKCRIGLGPILPRLAFCPHSIDGCLFAPTPEATEKLRRPPVPAYRSSHVLPWLTMAMAASSVRTPLSLDRSAAHARNASQLPASRRRRMHPTGLQYCQPHNPSHLHDSLHAHSRP